MNRCWYQSRVLCWRTSLGTLILGVLGGVPGVVAPIARCAAVNCIVAQKKVLYTYGRGGKCRAF